MAKMPRPRRKITAKITVNALNSSIKQLIHRDVNKHWDNTLNNLPTGSKGLWKLSRKLRGQAHKKLPNLVTNTNAIASNPQHKIELIATEFQKNNHTTAQLDSIYDNKVARSVSQIENNNVAFDSSMLFTMQELHEALLQCKPFKASGLDSIPNVLIKKLPLQALNYLLNIYNDYAWLLYWPNVFKCAKVIPIPKAGKAHDKPGNYRPISLLNTIGKIMEKLLLKRIDSHTTSNSIIIDAQFGFRKSFSTTHQLKRVVNQLKENKTQRKSTGAIFMDIEKAFDCIWHNGLLHKLKEFKYPMYVIKLIKSFLTDRKFSVYADGRMSEWRAITAGLPQGSSLSAILYSIYTADIPIPRDCEAAFFADDAAYLIAAKSSNVIVKKLNKSITTINKYYKNWKIKINAGKTQAVLFPYNNSRKRTPSVVLKMGETTIHFQNSAKYLGLTLDHKLNFAKHIESKKRKAYARLAMLYPLIANKYLSTKNKIIIYKSILRPAVTYASPIWGGVASCHHKKLQIFQNKCLKTNYQLNWRTPTNDLTNITGIPMLKNHIDDETIKFQNKCTISAHSIIRGLFQF
jgi:hypothetical protein